MTDSDTKTSEIIKLNHYNYESWRDEIRPLLLHQRNQDDH